MERYLAIAVVLSGCAHAAAGPGSGMLVGEPSGPATRLSEGLAQGAIEPCDPRDEDGRSYDDYVFSVDRDARVRVWVASAAFDGVLEVWGPEGLHRTNDDFVPGTLSPLIELASPVAGNVRVRVLSLRNGQTGPYELGLARIDASTAPSLSPDVATTGTIAAAGAGPGILTGASYWVTARAGERLRLRVTSSEFDTTAALVGPRGQTWTNDDANDTGPDGSERPLDSTIVMVAPEAGQYHLIVAPYGGHGAGQFRVVASSRPPVVLEEGREVPAAGFAGRESEGRLLGLFAGITEYPAGHSNLYGCADDATLLARAFRERGLMSAAEQTLLTDMSANRAAFTAGLQRLAAESTARDVVVIFYSGHGGSVARDEADPADLDGTDETLILYDGILRDDEVVALIDQITADVIILALDSCHSGGFARDFLTRPGRIGLFSSDEDVLSDTAEPLLAGGYLSYSLRRAVLGHADAMPADGALFAGELTDYVHGQFVAAHAHINPEGTTSPMQWLVSRRGSVAWSDVLWLYPRRPDGALPPIPDIALDSAPPADRPSGAGAPRPTSCP